MEFLVSVGRRGCFERYASISALKKMMGEENLEEIFYLADKNSKVQNVLDTYLESLSDGLANVINMYLTNNGIFVMIVSKYRGHGVNSFLDDLR